jgi:hypothetical protein
VGGAFFVLGQVVGRLLIETAHGLPGRSFFMPWVSFLSSKAPLGGWGLALRVFFYALLQVRPGGSSRA